MIIWWYEGYLKIMCYKHSSDRRLRKNILMSWFWWAVSAELLEDGWLNRGDCIFKCVHHKWDKRIGWDWLEKEVGQKSRKQLKVRRKPLIDIFLPGRAIASTSSSENSETPSKSCWSKGRVNQASRSCWQIWISQHILQWWVHAALDSHTTAEHLLQTHFSAPFSTEWSKMHDETHQIKKRAHHTVH